MFSEILGGKGEKEKKKIAHFSHFVFIRFHFRQRKREYNKKANKDAVRHPNFSPASPCMSAQLEHGERNA
jgi:hypothetical protein